jgi:hypothetical protein
MKVRPRSPWNPLIIVKLRKRTMRQSSKICARLWKAGATRVADNGAAVTELEAIFDWRGGGMAVLYTKVADRKRAALGAMSLLKRPAEK